MYDTYAEAIEDTQICTLSVHYVERHMLAKPRTAIRVSGGLMRPARGRIDRDCLAILSKQMA